MITPYHVYCAYRKAKANGKKYRLASEDTYRNKISTISLLEIDKCSQYFNTLYTNINLELYMVCGFKVYKGFSFQKFLDPKILEEYKLTDKRIKRNVDVSKEDIDASFKCIGMPLYKYCKCTLGQKKLIIDDYQFNRIHGVIVVYCIKFKLVSFMDDEEDYFYNIINQYDKWLNKMYSCKNYIESVDDTYKEIDDEKNKQTIS